MSVLNNGYQLRSSGLLVRSDVEKPQPDTYMPANGGLKTIPRGIPPVVSAPPINAVAPPATSKDDAKAASLRVKMARRRARVYSQLTGVPDHKVTRAKSKMERAVELEALTSDPRAEAYSNRRVRVWTLCALAVFALGGALLSAVFSALSITEALDLRGLGWFGAAMGPDMLMGGLLALGLFMRSITAQRGLTLSSESQRAYRRTDKWLGGLIAVITVGPSIGGAVAAAAEWWGGAPSSAFGWALVSVAVHAIGPVVVLASGGLAPHITGDLARISQHTAQRSAGNPATSGNEASALVNGFPHATSENGQFSQVNGHSAATSGNSDPVIARARRELAQELSQGPISAKKVAEWHRKNIGPIEQKRVGEIRDVLNTNP